VRGCTTEINGRTIVSPCDDCLHVLGVHQFRPLDTRHAGDTQTGNPLVLIETAQPDITCSVCELLDDLRCDLVSD
jgi:hypothetical protein